MQKTENFKYKAMIDWIDLEISTVEKSNFQTVRRFADVKYVEPINPKGGGASNTFSIKFHDITSWQALEDKIFELNCHKPISLVYIKGVEISFDAYSINNNKSELIEKTAEFYWLLQNPSSSNRRTASNYKGSAEQPINHLSNIRKIASGNSLYIGSQKDDSISQRIYYKTIDSNQQLAIEEHRARYELTLKGTACPFNTIEEAKAYSFTDLKSWFKFRKIKDNLDGYRLMITKARMQLGDINSPRISGGGLVVHNVGTQADINLNRIAYDKLRELTKRLQ